MEKHIEHVPRMREGVAVVRRILYVRLEAYLAQKHPEKTPGYVRDLAHAVCNDLFGPDNAGNGRDGFAEENAPAIEEEAVRVGVLFNDLRILLTDALRVSVLCDWWEGRDSRSILEHARQLGVIVSERDMPRPASFVELAGRMAGIYGVALMEGGERGRGKPESRK
ncbi:MAG: hypothetical protein ACLFOY_02005 [Desulfatibacillaceae bacterium]